MKVTKFEHACLDVREGNSRLVIDPGDFSPSFTDVANIDVLVLTHIHGDHFSPKKVEAILNASPNVKIYTTKEVSKELKSPLLTVPERSKPITVGAFTLEFYGEDHATIDPQTPIAQNMGVLVNEKLYYPGDSFTSCPKPFHTLAIPSSAPWLKIGDIIPLIEESKCHQVFQTHDALLSDIGHASTNRWLTLFAERSNKTFKFLRPGESVEI